MTANDLFSFLDPTADDNDDAMVQDAPEAEATTSAPDRPATPSNLKRKADTNSPNSELNIEADQKRPRMDSPNPIVLDDFETEAKREVAASAGLTGAATEAGSRLELRHQVHLFAIHPLCSSHRFCVYFRFVIKLWSPLDSITLQYQNMYLPPNPTANTNLSSIPSRECRCMRFNGTRVSWCRPILVRERQS
jgi:hypothetical protein